MDFDSEELAGYPDVHRRVVDKRDLEPGAIMIGGRYFSLWDVPYARLVQEFKNMGAMRARKSS